MRMRFLALVAILPSLAVAQSVPQMSPPVTLRGPTGLNWAMGLKADATNGALTTPTITGGNATGLGLSSPSVTGGTATGMNVNRVISLLSYGAKCDGVTDDTAAISAWLANATGDASVALVAPPGTCVFTSTLSNPAGRSASVSLSGAGAYSTTFLYTGANTTSDLISIGDSTNEQTNWNIHDFRVMSSTKMTGGSALHLRGLSRSGVGNIVFDGQEGNGNLWNGPWYDGLDHVMNYGFGYAWAQNDAVRLNAEPGLGAADFSLQGWKISPPNGVTPASNNVGVHIGGGFGGLTCSGGTDIIGNGTNMLVDTALEAVSNREFYMDGGCALDSAATGHDLDIEDTLSSLYFSFAGAWFASAHKSGIYIAKGVNGWMSISGGTIYNNQADGITDNGSMTIAISGTQFRSNGQSGTGYGFNEAGGNQGVSMIGASFWGNRSGQTSGQVPNVAAFGGTQGGIQTGSRVALQPDSTLHACVEGASQGVDNCAFGMTLNSSNQTTAVHLGNNGAYNPILQMDSPAMWTANTSLCGSLSGAKGCLIWVNPNGLTTYVPSF